MLVEVQGLASEIHLNSNRLKSGRRTNRWKVVPCKKHEVTWKRSKQQRNCHVEEDGGDTKRASRHPPRVWFRLAQTQGTLGYPWHLKKDCATVATFRAARARQAWHMIMTFYAHRRHARHTSLSRRDKCKLLVARFTFRFFLFCFFSPLLL